jgi:hypothetical protein
MKNAIHFMMTGILALAAGGGCVLEGSEPAGAEDMPPLLQPAIIVTNGYQVNGSSFNGLKINGTAWNSLGAPGTEIDGSNAAGTGADGSPLSGITLDGSGMRTVRISDGAVLSGAALVGATFSTQSPDGSPIELRIDTLSMSPSQHHAGSAVNRYTLSYREGGSSAWAPVCVPPEGVTAAAVPLAGRWSYEQGVPGGGDKLDAPGWITFACAGYALYKCVDLGYEPWTSAGGVPLGDHHRACVRMLRADYCGNGTSYTVDGTVINVFDALGIQQDTESWLLEAEWDVDGARCLSRQRIQGGATPDCAPELAACEGPPGWGETLLVSEAP